MLSAVCSGDLSGRLETRCDQLTNRTTHQPVNLSGFVLVLNLTRLKCRLLMEGCLARSCQFVSPLIIRRLSYWTR